MNLFILTTHVMIALAKGWLSPGEAYNMLFRDELGRALLGKLVVALDVLARRQHQRNSQHSALATLTERTTALDGRHDNKARAIYYQLKALEYGTEDPDRARTFHQVRKSLFVKGLRAINESYLDEAGAVIELETRLEPEDWAFFESIPFEGETLAHTVREWIEAGKVLGEATQARDRLKASLRRDGTNQEDMDLRAARRLWARVVRQFMKSLDLIELTPAVRESIEAPLHAALAAAASRAARGENAEEDEDETMADPDPDAPDSTVDEEDEGQDSVPAQGADSNDEPDTEVGAQEAIGDGDAGHR